MRSQLTRSVFRRLLSNEGFTFRCPSQASLIYRNRHHGSQCILRPSARRSLFGFSRKPDRVPKDPDIVPGYSKMMELGVSQNVKTRPPPAHELVAAWRAFLGFKRSRNEVVNSLQAKHLWRTFDYLQQVREQVDEAGRLTEADLVLATFFLHSTPTDETEWHNKLARGIYKAWSTVTNNRRPHIKDFKRLIITLTLTGDSMEARDLWIEKYANDQAMADTEHETDPNSKAGSFTNPDATLFFWHTILAGFAKENNEAQLLKTYDMAEANGVRYNHRIQQHMVSFYASKDDVEATKKWFTKPLVFSERDPRNFSTFPETLSTIWKFCIRNDEFEWSKTIFRDVLASNMSKAHWDVVLQWAAGAMGKGVEDVERMIQVMIRRNEGDEAMKPDIDTINGLVDLAISLKDPYLAERYIALGQKFGIQPNAKTFILQMEYRATAGDLTGAQSVYDALQAEEVLNDQDLPAINRYIRALCASKMDQYDRIIAITSDLEERKKRLEADTVAALALMYIQRDQLQDVTDLLQTQSYHYTLEERFRIRDAILAFCLDRNTTTARAWEAYTIMRHVFDETVTEIRTTLMKEFFARRRCDMACHVFGHMRQHTLSYARPVLETYIQCFLGIASCRDREHLDMVHNMLKMDSAIEPNTRLYNSLILAYTECDDAGRALGFWEDITNSNEGPSYRTLEIVFRACGRKPFGDKIARKIWNKMKSMEIEITQEVFAAYVGALAGQGKWEEARGMVEVCEKELGLTVDVNLLGTFYNALPGQNRKDLVEEWAKESYPTVWKDVEKLGQTVQLEGHRLFNMPKREMKA